MNKTMLLTIVLALTACGQSEYTDSVESLVAHPDRLHEVEGKCADKDAKMPAAECSAASEARHRLFIDDGPKYTPSKDAPKF